MTITAPTAYDLPINFEDVIIDTEARTFEGIAVPWNKPTMLNGQYYEVFRPGSIKVKPDHTLKLMHRHTDLIGRILEYEDRPSGWWIKGKLAKTSQGNDSWELVKEEAFDGLSIGIDPNLPIKSKYDDVTKTVEVEEVYVREVSLAAFPKLNGTTIDPNTIREDAKGNDPMTTAPPAPTPDADLAPGASDADNAPVTPTQYEELNRNYEDLQRTFASFQAGVTAGEASTQLPEFLRESPTMGDFLVSIAEQAKNGEGSSEYLREYNKLLTGENDLIKRSYAGGVMADSLFKETFIGEIDRIVNPQRGLRGFFSTGNPPTDSDTIAWAKIDANTIETITDADLLQALEGDNLELGKLTWEKFTAELKTYGLYSTISWQQARRSNVNVVNRLLQAQGRRIALMLNALVRVKFYDVFDEQVTATNTVAVDDDTDYKDWWDALVDAAEKAEDTGYDIEGLLVDKGTFKKLGKLEGEDGRPLLLSTGQGVNNVGTLNTKGLEAGFYGIRVICDPKIAHNDGESPTPEDIQVAAFANSEALRTYQDPLVHLEDNNIINLTKDFSLHTQAMVADEVPSAIIPVTFGG